MSLITILETIFIGPLKLCFEIIFALANRMIGHPGWSIIVLSLIMNILVLPLYKRADAMQEASRDIEAKLQKGIAHIKKNFSGDEKMMILQTYYRQNNYRPTDALNGSVSLLLEIPFFMAAYQFLSHLDILQGVSLGPIQDLGAPDGLLVIGGLSINVLPVLMTTVNVISSALYLKGFPLKTKIQLYGMALFFLVFLYTSPSCLVFYWTLNNLFSLVKTIFYKLKNPKKVLCWLLCAVGLAILTFGVFFYHPTGLKRKLFVVGVGVLMQAPLLLSALKIKIPAGGKLLQGKPNKKMFVLSGLFLTVFVGLLIPSTFIAASPQEYVDITYFHNPLWYLVSTVSLAAGFFLVWMRVFYWLASTKGKVIFDRLMWILCGVMLVNYMFFGTNLGVISPDLQYTEGMAFSAGEQLLNLAVICGVAGLLYLLSQKWARLIGTVLLSAVIAMGGMSAINAVKINQSVSSITLNSVQSSDVPTFNLSKNGKNVVVLMLDRAMGQYIPYLFNEKPELADQFDGFTYYSNTISFGGYTNFGTPPLLGGYEYTPVEMNKRDTETLVAKHNEALKVMPVLFAENGYDVTVMDPPYANYEWVPDLSIFDGHDGIQAHITKGKFSSNKQKAQVISNNHRNFFVFSLMKSMPLVIQPTIYNGGRYNQTVNPPSEIYYTVQTAYSQSVAEGLSGEFMKAYHVMENLANITKITEDDTKTFLFMANDMTHEPMLLKAPEYIPAPYVDNSAFDAENSWRFTVNGQTMHMESVLQMSHYQSNMAAMLLLGEWFDYLREQGVYDNTRIILVSDHGRNLGHLQALALDDRLKDLEFYAPLLMVKDFNSTGFTVSKEFMTNADVPTLAVDQIIENPVNPFTGKPITSDEKTAHDQFVILSMDWDVTHNDGKTFLPGQWASVKDDLWDLDNWNFLDEKTVLQDHKFPN